MKLWARHLALGLLLTAAIPSAAVNAAENAEQLLLAKANFWRLKDRADVARNSLDQLLTLNPAQPDALYQYGVLELQRGDVGKARGYLARLRKAAPADPRIASLQAAMRSGRVDPAMLDQARELSRQGDYGQAVSTYRAAFDGAVPPSYVVEYYLTLAATPQGREPALAALERMAQASPNDVAIKLALARVQTYSDAARATGIAALARLSTDPAVGPEAIRAWHQALLWLGGSPADAALYQQYLARFPQDTEVRQHLADSGAGNPANDGPSIDYQAYVDLQSGKLSAADQAFAGELRARPGDADGMAGLGMVRLRQARFAEARDLIGRAMQAAPLRKPEWTAAYDSAALWAGVQEAKSLIAARQYRRARTILASLLSKPSSDSWGAQLLLADVNAKLGDKPAAEAAYRRVLAVRPHDADASVGIVNTLNAEGRSAEAASFASRLSVAERARLGAGGGSTRGDLLRTAAKEAAARGDTATAQAKFREAVAAAAGDPWIRLDFARFLAAQGTPAQGFAVVDPSQTGNTAASLQAAAIFDSEQHRPADALAKLDRVPAADRTADMVRLHQAVLVGGTIQRARMLAAAGRMADARKALVALFNDPEVGAADRADIPHALAALGDAAGAAQLYQQAAAGGGPAGTKAAVDYGWLLLKGGRDTEAGALVAQIKAHDRGAVEDRDFRRFEIAVAVRKADALRRQGDAAAAYGLLAPLLTAHPDDPALLAAAGRTFADRGDPAQAMRYFETAYRRHPGNTDALAALIGGAIQAHDTDSARRFLDQAMQDFPSNARFYYLEAQLARAEGDNRSALRALETARTLNSQRSQNNNDDAALPGSGSSVPPPGSPDAASAGAGSSSPADDPLPAPLQDTATSADSSDLVASPAAPPASPAPQPAAATVAAGTGAPAPAVPAPAGQAATEVVASRNGSTEPVKQVAQLELIIPPPVGGYQPPVQHGPAQEQDSLELDIERSMAAIEAESAPQLQAGLIYRGRDGQDGTSTLNEVGLPIEGRFSPFLTGTMRISVTPLFLDAGSLGTNSLSVFGANELLLAKGLPGVQPGEQNAGGFITTIGYSFGPVSGKIGAAGLGFPVTNLIGNLAYQPKFLNDRLAVRIEALREPVTDSLLSYAGMHASLGAANAASGGAFGRNGTWGGVVKTGVRGSVFYDNTEIGAFGTVGVSFLQGENVAENGEREASVGAYFRPYKTENTQLRVGVDLLYFGFDKNLSYYTFGQGGYFSPQNYEALTFPVEYQGRTGRWSYLAAVALGVQHFNQTNSPFFPNNPFAQEQLAALVGPSNAVYHGSSTTGFAADLRAQVEYALNNSLSIGAAASYDNGHDYNESVFKLYIRKTFSDPTPITPILPITSVKTSK